MEQHTRSKPLTIGALVYPRMDQMDFTGPFEVLSRIPGASFLVVGKEKAPIRDQRGLLLTPETDFREAPQLDVLIIPGGPGQEELMDDGVVLSFLGRQAALAKYVFSICTGALLAGAAGLLRNVRATTHWSALDLLPYFGAQPVDQRVVVDGKYVSAAGVTAGLDGALTLASLLAGRAIAEQIALEIEYAPQPPVRSGEPRLASPDVLRRARESAGMMREARRRTALRVAERLGVRLPERKV